MDYGRPNETVRGVSGSLASLSPNQQRAMSALLSTTSIPAAAQECGLGISTIKKYLSQETFSRLYREQRMLILQETVAGITHLGAGAIKAFEDALEDGDLNERLRAATRVLDYIYKGAELERRIRDQEELERRIQALEAAHEYHTKTNGRIKSGS